MVSFNGETVGDYELGNPWTYRGKALTWKNVHRLASYDGIEFKYNYAGIRTSKTVDGVTTKYATSDGNIVAEQKGDDESTRITYYYGVDGVTAFRYNGVIYYYEKNFLGDVIGIYNANKKLVARYEYDAWGNHKVFNANGTVDTSPAFIGNKNPFRYRSYYFDVETGLYYLQSRYYDPEVGRFISMDEVEYLDPSAIHGLNLFAYCINNPIMYVDPSGQSFIVSLLVATLVGAAIGGAIGGVTAKINGDSVTGGVLSGATIGGVMGAVTILGGATALTLAGKAVGGFALAALGKGALLATSVGITALTSFIAGIGSYAIEQSFNKQQLDWSEALLSGVYTTIKGLSAFTVGMLLAAGGGYSFLLKGAVQRTILQKIIGGTMNGIVGNAVKIIHMPWYYAL